jgi:type 1 glutamine amidotransferase
MHRRVCVATVLGITCFLSAGCAAPKPSTRVLMVVGGDHHDYDTLPRTLAARLVQRGDVQVDLVRGLAAISPTGIRRYHVLLFNNCEQPKLDPAVREAVMEHISGGAGLVAMHCALWSYQDWPEWLEMIGGLAIGHDAFGRYEVVVVDPWHATMLGAGNRFEITDEPYLIDGRAPEAEVLARTAKTHRDAQGNERDGPEPQIWTRTWGRGRVYAITFGHDEQSQSDERFITLLHNGVRWTAGTLPDTRHNVLTRSEEQAGFELLFSGRDLSGWTGDTANWTVENGELVGRSADLPHNKFLITEREYGDFLLRYSVRLINHNSGVHFRGTAHPNNDVKGYQADVADRWYGSLYADGRGIIADGWETAQQVLVLDGWNEMTVRAIGPRIVIALNGVTTVDYTEPDPAAQPAGGVIALQLHSGEPMEVRFRDIRIQRLGG